MAIAPDSRITAELIEGSVIYFIQDGTELETNKTSSLANPPTFAEAMTKGVILGTIKNFKFNPEFKTLTKEGVDPDTQQYTTWDVKILQKLKPTFSTMDVVPEAHMLELGLASMPEKGSTAKPFSNTSGVLKGYLAISLLDSYRTLGEDGELAQVLFRGYLGLADTGDNTSDLKTVNYEFQVTYLPSDGFKNIAIETTLGSGYTYTDTSSSDSSSSSSSDSSSSSSSDSGSDSGSDDTQTQGE